MGKIAGKDLVFKIGSPLATVGIFDPNIDESADEIDVTDSGSGDDREYITGFNGRTLTFAKWYKDTDTALALGDSIPFAWVAGTKQFQANIVITGRKSGATREDAHRFDYTARITGTPTKSWAE